jgi:hypothetical protein
MVVVARRFDSVSRYLYVLAISNMVTREWGIDPWVLFFCVRSVYGLGSHV